MPRDVTVDGVSTPVNINTAAEMVKSGAAVPSSDGTVSLVDPYGQRALSTTFFSGNAISNSLTQPFAGRKDALLSYEMLRLIARRSGIVKPPIDFVVRSLSSTPYRIRAVDGMRVPKKAIRQAEELLVRPMAEMGMDTFPDVLSKLLRDQMVLDHGIILKHRGKGGGMEAFECMDAATFLPVQSETSGRLKKWAQRLQNGQEAEYTIEDVVSYIIHRRSDSLFGEPPLESVVHEVNATLNASRSFSTAMNDNEIPPGVLFLMGADNARAMSRLERQIRRDRGIKNDYALKVIAGVERAQWVPFQRPYHEMQVVELLERLERIIFRVFGVDRIAMGSAQDVNRSTAEAMLMTRHFSLFKPLLDIWANKFTFEILQEIHPGLFIEFIHFARTGMATDLVGVGPTGSISDEAMQVGPGGGDEGSQSLRLPRACGGCDGRGHVLFHYNGDPDAVPCPDCGGRGVGGPVFVSRPNHGRLLLPPGLNRMRGYRRNPASAWRELASSGSQERLRNAIELARGRVTSACESVADQGDMLRVGRLVQDTLIELYVAAHDEASGLAERAGVSQTKTGLNDAKSRVYDLVRFQINQPLLAGADVRRIAVNTHSDASALCDLAERVAGLALIESVENAA